MAYAATQGHATKPITHKHIITAKKKRNVPVVTVSSHVVKVNSIVHFQVVLHNTKGKPIAIPKNALIHYSLTNSNGAFLIPSTHSVMITRPGLYKLSATINGVTSNPAIIQAVDVVSGVQLSAEKSFLVADGNQLDTITATVVDANFQRITTFNGTAALTPLAHGTYINPRTKDVITSLTFVHGIAKFDVEAGTAGGTNDTIMLTGLTPSSNIPISSMINYESLTLNYTWSTAQPAGVQLNARSTAINANGTESDQIKATVVNGYGQPVTFFNGTASLTPLAHGTYVDPATGQSLNSITFQHGQAIFDVKAGTTGGVSDTISLFGLTATGQEPASGISYQVLTVNYVWASGEPVAVQLSAASPSIVANGEQTDTFTATVVDAYGQPVTNFNGTATLSPLQYGTYVDSATNSVGSGNITNTVTFVNGVGTFAVKAGTMGGVSDIVGLSNISANGQAMPANFTYGTSTLAYTWGASNAVTMTAETGTLSNMSTSPDIVTAMIPSTSSSASM